MNAGYVRLSRDDDKRNYVSIENQKLIISRYAEELGEHIDQWFEDDGISGYKFDRPGFNQLMDELDKDINTVFVKDFSRLGRHNAKVLLLIDEFLERQKRLIVIDDDYDSLNPEDDVIGIKTWYNERYVKDTSKKIRRALGARQKEGTLPVQVPFGYRRNVTDREIVEVVEEEARYILYIVKLYLEGYGYRRIAGHLNRQGLKTPSFIRREQEQARGRVSGKKVTLLWSDGMVKRILDNDFYIGNYRLHKRVRSTVHGKDKRVPREEQYVFTHHHPAIIDEQTFKRIQEIREKRISGGFQGGEEKNGESVSAAPFAGYLFCLDCGSRLTPIVRKTREGLRRYYICSTYNSKGKNYCSKSHLVEEKVLAKDMMGYAEWYCDMISRRETDGNLGGGQKVEESDKREKNTKEGNGRQKSVGIMKRLNMQKKHLKVLFEQKARDISLNPEHREMIEEGYNSLQQDILCKIQKLEEEIKGISDDKMEDSKAKNQKSIGQRMKALIDNQCIDRQDVEDVIKRINVNGEGVPEITIKSELYSIADASPENYLNLRENRILLTALEVIHEEKREYISTGYIADKLTDAGFLTSKTAVLPYIGIMLELGILIRTENKQKPYIINSDRRKLTVYREYLHKAVPIRRNAADGI